MKENKPKLKPLLKWVGGKRRLLPELLKRIPDKDFGYPGYRTYYEPFIGGGALFLALTPGSAVLSDVNSDLMRCYRVIQSFPGKLIDLLLEHQENDSSDYYYEIRSKDRESSYKETWDDVAKAARTIYLNKACRSGLFRVNSSGEFNTPYGKYRNPNICDGKLIWKLHEYFVNESARSNTDYEVTFNVRDFESQLSSPSKGDFVYLDPPYDPISNTSSFTGYSVGGFSREDHRRLKRIFDELTKKGCQVMLSNSKTDFILDLYKDYSKYIEVVKVARTINSDPSKRCKIDEIIVTNYNYKELVNAD